MTPFALRPRARLGAALTLTCALTLGLVAPASAAALDLHGVKVDDTTELAGKRLPLNGAGTRYKVIFKVYVAALYAGKKAGSLDALVQQDGPKRLVVTMLRDIDANELGKLLTRGIEDNMPPAAMPKLIGALARMGQIFAEQKQLKAGDVFSIDWVPGQGTVVTVKGQAQGEPFKEPTFFAALMSIWLGPKPADDALKEGLLGAK